MSNETNDAGEKTSIPIDDTLKERGGRYGAFKDHAKVSQTLQHVLFSHKPDQEFTLSQREALVMICHKLGRIVNGDPHYDDSWRDISGYATLIAEELNGKVI